MPLISIVLMVKIVHRYQVSYIFNICNIFSLHLERKSLFTGIHRILFSVLNDNYEYSSSIFHLNENVCFFYGKMFSISGTFISELHKQYGECIQVFVSWFTLILILMPRSALLRQFKHIFAITNSLYHNMLR